MIRTSSRSRPRHRTFACEECSRRKQRCDKNLPVCGPCQKAELPCSASAREKNVVQDSSNGVTRKGYVRLLEERVALLEAEARQKGFQFSSDGDLHVDENQRRENEDASPRPLPGDTSMNMNSLSLSAMAEPRSRAGEFLEELAMPRIIAGMTETYGGNPETTSRLDCLWDGIARDIRHPDNAGSHRLRLDREEALRSLEIYLDTVDFRFPKLQAAKVRSGIDAITAEASAGGGQGTYTATLAASPSHIFMAYMVTAIVPLVSDGYPASHGSFVSIHIMAKCLRVLDRVFRHEDGVDIIQCLHLLTVFAIHSSAAGSSWHLIGFAMDKCIALGYHHEAGGTAGVPDDEIQQRRWAFWSCYFLEVILSGALDRPTSIDDRYVTVSLPGELVGSPAPGTGMLSDIEARHVHMFQYARLMSLILLDTDSEDSSFRCHLSRLLHWRTLSPSHSAPGLEKAYAHETSLFHTLMLRAGIQQIIKSEDSQSNSMLSIDYVQWRRDEIHQMRLLDICQAVVQSLDRHTMIARPYLSVTTGYSAFSVGLAVVYYKSCNMGEDSADGLVESATRKLDVVSRQFPRMQDYRRVIELLHLRTQRLSMEQYNGSDDSIQESNQLISGIGPDHLKRLARATVTCLDIISPSFQNIL